jgi:nitrate reductase (cytochrome), electron transfer subunit
LSFDRSRSIALALGLFLVASGLTIVAALRVAVKRAAVHHAVAAPVVRAVAPSADPIRAEAQVFRTAPTMVAIAPAAPRERRAHPRRLATVHFLRGFEGAPPRIPHSLTAAEFRTFSCKTCHERGGFSERFTAYVPLTPHPERGICLQCHVGVDSVIGEEVADSNPNGRCPICHGSTGGPPRPTASLTWSTTVWPTLPRLTTGENPPPIPHDLQFRENCLTCHAGPAAVAEIRTLHPERANCRQCHVALSPGVEAFVRGESP